MLFFNRIKGLLFWPNTFHNFVIEGNATARSDTRLAMAVSGVTQMHAGSLSSACKMSLWTKSLRDIYAVVPHKIYVSTL